MLLGKWVLAHFGFVSKHQCLKSWISVCKDWKFIQLYLVSVAEVKWHAEADLPGVSSSSVVWQGTKQVPQWPLRIEKDEPSDVLKEKSAWECQFSKLRREGLLNVHNPKVACSAMVRSESLSRPILRPWHLQGWTEGWFCCDYASADELPDLLRFKQKHERLREERWA